MMRKIGFHCSFQGSSETSVLFLSVASVELVFKLFLYSVYAALKNSVHVKFSGVSIGEGLVRMKRLRATRKMT